MLAEMEVRRQGALRKVYRGLLGYRLDVLLNYLGLIFLFSLYYLHRFLLLYFLPAIDLLYSDTRDQTIFRELCIKTESIDVQKLTLYLPKVHLFTDVTTLAEFQWNSDHSFRRDHCTWGRKDVLHFS